MNAQEAIKILAGAHPGCQDEAVQELSVWVLFESEHGDPDSSLTDWISAGQYTGNETVESIAAEWDDRD